MIEQLVLPKILREDALLSYHDCKAGGGHTGIKKTYAALHLKKFWPGIIKHYEDPRDHRGIVNDENQQNPEDTENNDNIIPNDTQNELKNDNKNEVSDNEQDENSNDPEFLAEKLTAKKRRNGKIFYKVKWLGYKQTTWVPEEDIGEGLLVDFYTKFTKEGIPDICNRVKSHGYEKSYFDYLNATKLEDIKNIFMNIRDRLESIQCKVVFIPITTMNIRNWNAHRFDIGKTSNYYIFQNMR
ncbi:unnamed protein product [Mytilus coruscus]|uniref:Chromo domain-containing protein n=1 Tax=Mytilus coruscus TaxID=42192 RepID=A0A6J8D7U4_MYTCO|nr:unnamed protein product [Mytilus coruscus]